MYDNICNKLHQELEELDQKLEHEELRSADLDTIDKISHALKSLATYEAMEGSSQHGSYRSMDGGNSYRRGRDSMGRFTSRDMGRGEIEPGRENSNWYPYRPEYDRRY